DSDTPDTPPLPTHGMPFTEITSSTQRLPVIPPRDSSSDSSSEASSYFHSDASSDSSLRHLLSDHSSPDLPSTFVGLSRKRRRSPMTSIPELPPVSGVLSPIRADLIPSPKRIRDSVIAYADALRDRGIDARVVVEAVDRVESETGARGPVEVRVERVTHPVMPDDIPEPAQEGAVEVTYETLGDLVQRFHDHTEAIPVHRIQVIEGVQREQGHRIVGVESAVTALTKRIAELERDNSVRHSADHSSSDSSSEASLDFHSDASSDSSSGHSLSDHSSPDLPNTFAGPSRKRRRSPTTSVPALSPVSAALSPVHADLIPLPKRVKDSGYLADVKVNPREISLRDDVIIRVSNEPYLEQDIDLEIQAEIDECIAYADTLRDRGIDARVVVEAVDRDETETGVRGPVEEGTIEVTYETLGDLVQRFYDHTQAIPVHRIRAIEGVQREQGHRIIGVESAVTALTERVAELERDNRRLRGTVSVESQRVDRLQRGMSRMQRELRQMRRLQFYDRVAHGLPSLEMKMPNTRSRASMTHEEVEELVNCRVAEEMEACEAAMNLKPMNENGDEQEGGNRGNGGNGNGRNGGNGNEGNGENGNGGNGHRNGNHGMNYIGFMSVARECTF
ncbi:hypothetical protein Tco_1423023, partial [Tanacetum coccineum]